METLKRIKSKVFKYWWVAIGVVLIVIGFFIGRKRSDLKRWRAVEERIDEVEEDEELRRAEVRQAHTNRIRTIEEEHVETIEALTEDQQERYENLRDKPVRLNNYLNSLLPK